MHCDVSKIDSTTRYKYTFEDNTSCVFLVSKAGVIYIDIRERILYDFLCCALEEVSNMIAERGLTPTINIKNSNIFLKVLAKKAKFKQIYSRGVSFSMWVRH